MDAKLACLAALMLLFGSISTIALKYQDETVVGHTKHNKPIFFQHPALQTCLMFAGEFSCLIIYIVITYTKAHQTAEPFAEQPEECIQLPSEPDRSSRHSWKAGFAFLLPALLDTMATTLLNLGLYYTYASTFQMLRGTLALFAGLLTIIILKRRLHSHHWLGMVLITAGAAIVGAASTSFQGFQWYQSSSVPPLLLKESAVEGKNYGAHDRLRGNLLVVLAQLLTALQFIVEEKYLKGYRVPTLLAIGLEGMWGLLICAIGLPLLSFVNGPGGEPLEDLRAAWRQVQNSTQLQASVVTAVVAIAAFNYFGIKVTKRLSGAARATIDACRTLFVWFFAILVGWEKLHGLQVVGFVVLLVGTSMYNELLRSCLPDEGERRRRQLREPLLNDEALTWTHHQSPAAAIPVPGWGRPPLPPSACRPSRPRTIDSSYTMARSMRIAPGAFSPRSMASIPSFEGAVVNDASLDQQTVQPMQREDCGNGDASFADQSLLPSSSRLGNMPSPSNTPPRQKQPPQNQFPLNSP